MKSARKPLIGVTGNNRQLEGLPYHTAGDKYLIGVTDGAGGIPVVVAAMGDAANGGRYPMAETVDQLDGLLVTGSNSNVEPHHYDGPPSRAGTLHDPARDATTLPLIRAAVDAGLPVLALCRGIQELNVALGGSLHQHVHELPGKHDHRMPESDDMDVRYGPRHTVELTPGGVLAAAAAAAGEDAASVMVNSLHSQAIDRLGDGLAVEAMSADGVIEGVRVERAAGFAIGVQWHPEYKVRRTPFYHAIFRAFGDACRACAAGR